MYFCFDTFANGGMKHNNITISYVGYMLKVAYKEPLIMNQNS